MRLEELLDPWRSDELREYVRLLGGSSDITRKAERISFIAQMLLDKDSLRDIWLRMDEISRRAVSFAFHNQGEFRKVAFVAQYGTLPPRPQTGENRYSYYNRTPIFFDLIVIDGQIPHDLLPMLSDLVMPPERFQVEGTAELPATVDAYGESVDLVAIETEVVGRTDLVTYLQLMEQGQLRFSRQNRNLTANSLRKVLAHLVAEDYRQTPDKATARTTIRPTGLENFARESGLATPSGALTDAGRAFLRTQAPEIMLDAFEKWTADGAFDELHRIAQLGGLNSRRTKLTAPASRRDKVIEALSWCPVDQWISTSDFYRAILIWNFDFEVEATRFSNLYVGSRYYGDLNSIGESWQITNGLYINVLVWEYLATIGAVDVAFLADEDASQIDVDYLPVDGPLSLYDGLTHFRVNPWGAFLLGQADEYVPSQRQQTNLFTIDADRKLNLLVSPAPNLRLQLEMLADPVDESSYQLDQIKVLDAVEGGWDIDHIIIFLRENHQGDLPPDILDWLRMLQANQGAFTQLGRAVLIRLRRADLLATVHRDDVLSSICHSVDDRTIMVRSSNVTRLKNRLKLLGYLVE